MHGETRLPRAWSTSSAPAPLQAFGAVALVFVLVPALFWSTTASMVHTWYGTVTFNHCFLVPALVLWLVWQARFQLAAAPPEPYWPAAIGVGLAGLAWVLAGLANAVGPSQWAMTAMIPLVVLTLFGPTWTRVIAFPLLFLFFAVPFGDVLVPTLMRWTADFTAGALRALGIPVFHEGNDLVIPSGRWSVVEACSGIRFLIATVMAGTLYAWLMYRTPIRRAVFIAASIGVPIVANWLRALMIVLLGHFSNNELAAGVDHLVYGWVFFALVLSLLFWVGAFWRESADPAPAVAPSQPAVLRFPWMAASVCVALLVGAQLATTLFSSSAARGDPGVPLIEVRAGWSPVDGDAAAWRPLLSGANRTVVRTFEKGGRRVSLVIGQFRNQVHERELVAYRSRFATEDDRSWRAISNRVQTVDFGADRTTVRSVVLAGDRSQMHVLQWYWLGQGSATSDVRAKIDLVVDRLFARGDDAAWVAVFALAEPGSDVEETLAQFVSEMGPSLHAALAEAAR